MSVTEYCGPRQLVPAPPPHKERWGRAALFFVVSGLLILWLIVDARARYQDVRAPPVACDLSPQRACPIFTSHGAEMVMYVGEGYYAPATMTPVARGG